MNDSHTPVCVPRALTRNAARSVLATLSRFGLAVLVVSAAFFHEPTAALQVTGLYSYKVPVVNESNSERNRAYSEALSAVIVKITGERRWLLDPVVVRAIRNAQSYVEAVTYSSEVIESEPAPGASGPGGNEPQDDFEGQVPAGSRGDQIAAIEPEASLIEQSFFKVDFSAALINELLLDAKIPVWDSNRPSVLVWMTLQDEIGDRTFLTNESNPEIISLMRSFAEERGLPIIFPVFDFEDRRNVSEDSIWSLDETAIRQASERYGADSILSGRLHFTAGGELVGVWQFIFQDQTVVFDSVNEELESYVNEPLDKITTQLASYFAIVPDTSEFQTVQLRIDGIGSLEDYASLINYFAGLGLIESLTTKALDGERIDLSASLLGDSDQLAELIALDRNLLPIQADVLETSPSLHYRWTR